METWCPRVREPWASTVMAYPCVILAAGTLFPTRQPCRMQPSSMGLEVRDLLRDDLPVAARLLAESFAPAEGHNWLQARVSYEETLRGLNDRLGQSVMLVAAEDGTEVVGTVEVFTRQFLAGKQVRFWEGPPLDTYVSSLAVGKAARRRGVAGMLMESVEERAREAGEKTVSLQVDTTNSAALELYQKLGYGVVAKMNALTTPSRSGVVSKLVFGGARDRSLLALQKAVMPIPIPTPAAPANGSEQRLRFFGRLRKLLQTWRQTIWRLMTRLTR